VFKPEVILESALYDIGEVDERRQISQSLDKDGLEPYITDDRLIELTVIQMTNKNYRKALISLSPEKDMW
jgi:hypothetical protein